MLTTLSPDTSFWPQLPKPIIGLSPMDGVSDHPFRHIQKKYGHPAVIYTEFTSVEGVCHGAERLLKDFQYDETQRPVIAQVYGTTPEYFRQTAIALCHLGFDGIDINMGCPAKNVAHSGAGAALIKTPKLAQEIVRATQQGVREYLDGARPSDCANLTPGIVSEVERRHQELPAIYQQPRLLPVSVKTRIGFDSVVATEWVQTLLEVEPAAITMHGRTLKQQYGGRADWDVIAAAAETVHHISPGTIFLGNGDVSTYEDAINKIATYQLDGVLIGRATFGNPFAFLAADDPERQKINIFQIALEHAQLFEETYQHAPLYNFLPMRKHLGWYVKEIENARQIRVELFQKNTAAEVAECLAAHGLV